MDEIALCPTCHQPVKLTDYFCSNCGKNLRPRPLSTSLVSQISLYIKTLLLPPLGFIWGYRYLRQSGTGSKIVGLITIVITVIEVILLIKFTVNLVNTVNQHVYQQIQL
ncbi:MAG: hypothetical protein NTZ07_04160, partial [Candidatus Woesebacteria bacterium]|nr:hypothetical protein [Candidatus Woesebacteria bacterium]